VQPCEAAGSDAAEAVAIKTLVNIGSEPTPVAHRCLQDSLLTTLRSDARETLKRAARSFC
jgi:hypothetical protein